MSLKQKCEAGALKLVENAGTFAGARFRAQEAQVVTLTVPCVFAIAEIMGDACLASDGSTLGLKRVLLVVGIKGSADATTALPDPAASHAANVDLIRDVLQIDTLAGDLSATQTDFTVVAAVPLDPPPSDTQGRNSVDYFAWELIACEREL